MFAHASLNLFTTFLAKLQLLLKVLLNAKMNIRHVRPETMQEVKIMPLSCGAAGLTPID